MPFSIEMARVAAVSTMRLPKASRLRHGNCSRLRGRQRFALEIRAWLPLHNRPNSRQIPATLNSYPTRRNVDDLAAHLNQRNIHNILETDVVCYSTLIGADLIGCLKSWGTRQAAEHESGHSGVDPGFGGFRQCFIILAQSPAPAQPGESVLHHPASGQHLKAVAVPGTPH